MQCDNALHFTETDQTQCYNVTIYDDDICEYYNNENFQILLQIVLVEGSSAVDIDQEYGQAIVYIDDSPEPECGMRMRLILQLYTT